MAMGAWHYLILAKLQINNLLKKETVPLRGYQSKKLLTSACLHQTLMFLRWAFVKWSQAFCLEAEWYTATICSTVASDQQLNQHHPGMAKERRKEIRKALGLVCLLRHYWTRAVLKKKRLCVLAYHEFKGDAKAKISIYRKKK